MTESHPTDAPGVVSPRRREQWRAHYAMQAISRLPQRLQDTKTVEAYVRRAQSLPAMIQNMGLAGTIAFLLAKDGDSTKSEAQKPDKRLALDLSEWLLADEAGIGWTTHAISASRGQGVEGQLGAAISHKTTSALTYRRAATEAKHYANWLKRWSRAAGGTGQTADDAVNDATSETDVAITNTIAGQ
jgi:CRISPR type III-B/RAMP module-associated protein Cmr5